MPVSRRPKIPPEYSDETELFNTARGMILQGCFAQACRILYEYHSPLRQPLPMLFYRFIGDIAFYGGLSDITEGELDLIICNLHNADYYLSSCGKRQLHELFNSLYKAFMLLADLPVEHYSSQIFKNPYKRHGTVYGTKTVAAYTRTRAWLRRAAALGALAERFEKLHNDSTYGENYREMSASLWNAALIYRKPVKHSELNEYIMPLQKITEYLDITIPENRIKRQIRAKLKDPNAGVNPSYQQKKRNRLLAHVPTTIYCLAILGFTAVLSICFKCSIIDALINKAADFLDRHYQTMTVIATVSIIAGAIVYKAIKFYYEFWPVIKRSSNNLKNK